MASISSFDEWLIHNQIQIDKLTPQVRSAIENEAYIMIILEFHSFEERQSFLSSIGENNTKITILFQYNNLPTLWVQVTYKTLKILQENSSIKKIHANSNTYLSMHTIQKEHNISLFHESIFSITGQGIRIALLDSGIDQGHPDLTGRVVDVVNTVDEKEGDFNGHGTIMAGIIAGSGSASQKLFVGIAPDAELYDYKIFNGEGKGTIGSMLIALDYILSICDSDKNNLYNQKKPHILLFGGISATSNHLLEEYCRLLHQHNILIIAPTGNLGPDAGILGCPSNLDCVFTAGTLSRPINLKEKVAFYSGRGKASENSSPFQPSKISNVDEQSIKPNMVVHATDIIAPKSFINHVRNDGLNISDIKKKNKNQDFHNYLSYSGTSISAAIMTGLFALLMEDRRDDNVDDLIQLMQKNGTPISNGISNINNTTGYGTPNIHKILGESDKLINPPGSYSVILQNALFYSLTIVISLIIILIVFQNREGLFGVEA